MKKKKTNKNVNKQKVLNGKENIENLIYIVTKK